MTNIKLENLSVEELVTHLENAYYKVKENLKIEDLEFLTHDQKEFLVELGFVNALANMHYEIADDEEVKTEKWELDMEQCKGSLVDGLQNMANDINESLNGTYFSFDEYGDKVPSNKNESYEDMLKASVGYLREAAKDIEYREDLYENKLLPAYEDAINAHKNVIKVYESALSKTDVAIDELETTIMGLAEDQQVKVNSLLDAKDAIIDALLNQLASTDTDDKTTLTKLPLQ